MNVKHAARRAGLAAFAAIAAGVLAPGVAFAHARVSPPVSLAGKLQLYSLAVPSEKEGVTTTRIVLAVPSGFGIDSFVPPPAGWHRQVRQNGSGEGAVITRVTWTGGHTPTGEDSLFQFLGRPSVARSYTFGVQQIYSDGSIVNWDGSESSDAPAPRIEAVGSLGGGGVSVVSIVALIVGALGLLAGACALVGGSGDRELA